MEHEHLTALYTGSKQKDVGVDVFLIYIVVSYSCPIRISCYYVQNSTDARHIQ